MDVKRFINIPPITVLRRKDLSLNAKAFYIYIGLVPKDNFEIDDFLKISREDKETVISALKELINAGFLAIKTN